MDPRPCSILLPKTINKLSMQKMLKTVKLRQTDGWGVFRDQVGAGGWGKAILYLGKGKHFPTE